MSETILFKRLHSDAIIPTRGTPYSAGFDLYALEEHEIEPGAGFVLVKTGIAARPPPGHYLRVAMRSGLAYKNDLIVGAGVIDYDYTGDIGVLVATVNKSIYYTIKKGERIAQLIPERISNGEAQEVNEFPDLSSTHDGFGSTGKY